MDIENMTIEEIDSSLFWWTIGDIMNWFTSLSTLQSILVLLMMVGVFSVFVKIIFKLLSFLFINIREYLKEIQENFKSGLK